MIRISSYNTLKKIKCVLEERFVWAFHATGLSGFLLPKEKALLLPSTPFTSAAVIHPSLQYARSSHR